MGGRGGASLAGQMGHRHNHAPSVAPTAGATPEEGLLSEGADLENTHGHSHAGHRHAHAHKGFCGVCSSSSSFLLHLLGLDRFTSGRATTGLARASKASNPFDMGVVGNCKDFWTVGRELGVEYERLYEVPLEGFREAKRRREEEGEVDGVSINGGRKGLRERLRERLMGGMSMGGRRSGYEPVSQV